jgi:hypothetical protein
MKNNFKWLPFAALLLLFTTGKLFGQNSAINISVAGIEYDDAGFTRLKEKIKTNKKVQDVKQSFSQNTAKLTLTYAGDATALWDELPGEIKQSFKIITIDAGHIDLQAKNSSAGSNIPVTNTASNTNTSSNNDDCKNCYWNICNYDVIKSFGGKMYKGINTDSGTYYYNCDNGIVVCKHMMVNGYGVITSTITDTLLISGGPVGTTWNVNIIDYKSNGVEKLVGWDFSNSGKEGYKLIAKNITTTVGGKIYKDVIVVNYKGYSLNSFFGNGFSNMNYYYAKAVGLIRTDTLNFDSDPVAAINKQNNEQTIYSGGSVVKNGIDESLVGLWKSHDPNTNKDAYYRLNADGTVDYYDGAVTEANKVKGINHWKIESGYNNKGMAIIDFEWAGAKDVLRFDLSKKNDPVTGKPGILLNQTLLVAADNKKPW